MKNRVEDLRNLLFAQLEKLSDESLDQTHLELEIARAKSMVDVASTIIDSARAETEFLKATSEDADYSTKFFQEGKKQLKQSA